VRQFITHGGLLNTQEAIHRGLFFIGIPKYGEQRGNMTSFSIVIESGDENITVKSVTLALNEVLNNES
jgi:glucuronosyltransferase